MPEGCLDRSTGWLPSNAGSAIHGSNPPPPPPDEIPQSPLQQRDETAQSEADSRGKVEAVRDPAERISKSAVFYRDRGEKESDPGGGWLGWLGGLAARVCVSVASRRRRPGWVEERSVEVDACALYMRTGSWRSGWGVAIYRRQGVTCCRRSWARGRNACEGLRHVG